MATFQLLTKLSDNHGSGWSEQFFVQQTDIVAASGLMDVYAPLRLALLAQGFSIVQMVVSDVTVFRDSVQFQTLQGPQLNGAYAGAGSASPGNERSFERLLCRLEAGSTHRRAFELGGIPNAVLDQNGIYLRPLGWIRPFNAWSAFMTNGTFIHLKGQVVTTPAQTIFGLVAPANVRSIGIEVVGNQTATYTPNRLVRVSRCTYSLNVDGVWRVDNAVYNANTNLTTVTMQPKRYPPAFSNTTRMGQIVPVVGDVVTDYARITSVIPERGVRRKTGRPFGSDHGRQFHQG